MYLKQVCRFITFIFVSCLILLQCGCAALNFRHEYDKGMRAYNEKKYDEAIVNFNNALNYKPDSYSALCLLGTSYAYNKDDKMAEKTFQDAINLYPDNWNAYIFLADLKRSQHDYQLAREYYETAVSLESMGGKEKTYYKKLLKEMQIEENAYSMKNSSLISSTQSAQPKEIVNTYSEKKDENSSNDANQTGDVVLSIDLNKWEKTLDQKDEKSKIVTYGLKGEDVKNYNWTQLITVQYFLLTDNFNVSMDSYFNNHIGAIDAIAKNSNKSFEKKVINQKKNEIIYEWKFDNTKESEIARVIYTPKGIYHIHFAKKGAFSEEERTRYINLLKTAILK